MHEIPYLDLGRIHENIKEELDQAYREVLDRQWFIGGEADHRFEQEFAGQGHAWEPETDWMRSV